jgi:cytochrome c oxidase assembly factor CtaG
VRRTILWLIGVTVLFWVTNGGPHFYQTSLFSAHALTQTMLTAVIPLLLVPAAPVALDRSGSSPLPIIARRYSARKRVLETLSAAAPTR